LLEAQEASIEKKKEKVFLEMKFFSAGEHPARYSKVGFSEGDGIIIGEENILNAYLDSMETLKKVEDAENKEILVTCFRCGDFYRGNFRGQMQSYFIDILKGRRTLTVVWKPDENPEKNREFQEFFIPFLETGKVKIYKVALGENFREKMTCS
jgi:hypothetical protein